MIRAGTQLERQHASTKFRPSNGTPPGVGTGGQANESSILIEHHLAVSVDLDDWSQKQVPGWQGHHAGGHRESAP